MPSSPKCPECGADLAGAVPGAPCVQCLLRLGLDRPPETTIATAPDLQETTLVVSLPEQPGDRIGRYKLLQKIGEGGCGVVYMAEQQEPVRRRVALKVIKLGMDTRSVIARFEAERQALALMDHPNIAKVFDAGSTGPAESEISNLKSEIPTGRPYFVMELVRGTRITDYCDQNNLSTRERLHLFTQVCHAVQHAHQKGVIHRDIKPSNILVTLHDGVPVPKVIDFGIAKATSDQRLTDKTLFTAYEQFIGTPAYMSPEQAEMSGLDIDTRSDIYALGVLLYELLTGRTPFDARRLLKAGLDEIRRIIREEEPPRPSTCLSTLAEADLTAIAKHHRAEPARLSSITRGDLDWIAMKCLEKDRTRRYETANALAADIQRHLTNEPVIAGPPSNLYRVQKMLRRNKLGFAAAGAVLAALVIGLGVSLWQFSEKSAAYRRTFAAEQDQGVQRQRAEAEAQRAKAAAAETRRTLSQSHFQQATLRIAQNNPNDGLAYLAASLSVDPTSDAAAARLATLLAYQSWKLPSWEQKPSPLSAGSSSDNKDPVQTGGPGSPTYTKRLKSIVGGLNRSRPEELKLSVDGLRILVALDDERVALLDARTGLPVTDPLPHTNPFFPAQFSADGRWMLTATTNVVHIWDSKTGRSDAEPLQHEGEVFLAQFNSGKIITASRDNRIHIWDARTGRSIIDFAGQAEPTRVVHLSPNGKRLLTVAMKSVRLFDTAAGQALTEPLPNMIPNATLLTFQTRLNRIVNGSNITEPAASAATGQFSPDGNRFITFPDTRTVQIWSAQTGQPMTDPLRHESPLNAVQFSPDGRRILAATTNSARLWDAETGRPVSDSVPHDPGYISSQFSPHSKRLATATGNAVYLWDARTGQRLAKPAPHSGTLMKMRFSPDDRRLFTFSETRSFRYEVRLWSVDNGALTELLQQESSQLPPQFSPDGKHLFIALHDTLRFWDAETAQPLSEPLKHDSRVSSAQFNPDGRELVTVSENKLVRSWGDLTRKAVPVALRHKYRVYAAEFSPDGKSVLTAGATVVRLWNAQNGRELLKPLEVNQPVLSAMFSPDGRRILTVATNSVRLWDAMTGHAITEPLGQVQYVFGPAHRRDSFAERLQLIVNSSAGLHTASFTAQFTPDGRTFMTVPDDRTVRVADTLTGRETTKPLQHSAPLKSATFSSDGKRILTATINDVQLWDTSTGQALIPPLIHDGPVFSAQISSDAKRIVSISAETVRVWDAGTGQLLTNLVTHGGWLTSAEFSHDGNRIVLLSEDHVLTLLDSRTAQPISQSWNLEGTVSSAQLSQDGARLLTISGVFPTKSFVRVFDVESGQLMTEFLKHEAWVRTARFNRSGTRVVTASEDSSAMVWDPVTGQPIAAPFEHEASVYMAQFSPDGKRVLTVSTNMVRVWDVAPSRGPSPDWLIEVAEAVSGLKLNKQGALEPASLNRAEAFQRIRQRLAQEPGDDDWVIWGRWLLANPDARTSSPFSTVRIAD